MTNEDKGDEINVPIIRMIQRSGCCRATQKN